jgi:hypothetical protein
MSWSLYRKDLASFLTRSVYVHVILRAAKRMQRDTKKYQYIGWQGHDHRYLYIVHILCYSHELKEAIVVKYCCAYITGLTSQSIFPYHFPSPRSLFNFAQSKKVGFERLIAHNKALYTLSRMRYSPSSFNAYDKRSCAKTTRARVENLFRNGTETEPYEHSVRSNSVSVPFLKRFSTLALVVFA